MSLLLGLGVAFSALSAAGKGISSAASSRREKDALNKQIAQMENLVQSYKDAVTNNQMDLPTALSRIGAHFDKVGGVLNEHFKEQMVLGTEQINSRLEGAMDQIKFGIDQAKTRADRSERDYLEEEEEKLKAISKDYKAGTQAIRKTLTSRRLIGGAFIASMEKAQEKYNELQTNMAKSKSRFFRGIGEQFTDVVKAGGFQTLQAQSQAGREALGLQAQIGGQQAQATTTLAGQEFAAGEQARRTGLETELGGLSLEQQLGGMRTQAGAISPGADFFSGLFGDLSGKASQAGSDLLGAGMKKFIKEKGG